MHFGLFSINAYACSYPEAVAARGAGGRGGRLRVAVGRRARRAARSAGAALADGAAATASSTRSSRSRSLRRAHDAHPARHRHHHPAAAQPAGARQGAGEPRRAVERPADLRARRRLPRAGVPRARRALRGARRASPTSTSTRCARSGRRRSPPTRAASSRSPACRRIRGPCSSPHPPIVVGGRTRPAFRRAVQQGHGWYGFALDPEATAQAWTGLRDGGGSSTRGRPSWDARDQHHARPRAPASTSPPRRGSPRSACID